MQLGLINQNENLQRNIRKKQTGRAFSYAVCFSALMLILLMLESLIDENVFVSISRAIASALSYVVSALSDMSAEDARKSILRLMNTEVYSICFNIVIYLATIIIPYSILSKVARLKTKHVLKLNTDCPKRFWLYIPFTIGAGYILNFVVRIIFGGLLDRFTQGESELPHSVAGIILYFVMIAFLPAIVEEWAFRGVLLRSLLPYGKMFALVASSVTFGMMHVNPPQAAFAVCFGMLAGFIYIKTGSIWYGSIIHLLNNSISVVASYAIAGADPQSVVQRPQAVFITLVILSIVICSIIGLVIFIRNGFFKTGVMHSVTPPDKPKLMTKQYFALSFDNVFTIIFIILYVSTLLIRFFPEVIKAILEAIL